LSLLAVFAFSAVAAGAAQAVTGGPVWLVPCHKVTVPKTGAFETEAKCKKGERAAKPEWEWEQTVLLASETRNIAKVAGVSAVQKLKAGTLTIECTNVAVKSGATNTIIGGNPGTDGATLVFTKCTATKGTAKCLVKSTSPIAGGAEEIIVAAKTLLGYAPEKEEKTPFYEQFFPVGTSGEPNLFVELEFSGSSCGVLKGTKTKVNATGTAAPSPVGFGTKKCGVIAEVGKIKAGLFEAAVPGELSKLGGLNLPETALTKEKVWNSETKTFETVECTLEAAGGPATQIGVVSVELESGEEFGVEI